MKVLFCLLVISITVLLSCTKDEYSAIPPGKWRLVQLNWEFAQNAGVRIPAADSQVVLVINPLRNYVSQLNGKTVAQGTYSIATDAAYNNNQVLRLNDFKQTGIFYQFVVSQIGANGQVSSYFDGSYMTISNDTLQLWGPITPAGVNSFVFVRN